VTLETAIEQARRLWASVGTNMVPIPTAGVAGATDKEQRPSFDRFRAEAVGLLQDIGEA